MPSLSRSRVAAALIAACLLLSAGIARPAAPPARGGPVVSDVIVQGNRLVSTETIRNTMKTRAGKPFVAETVQEDIRALFKGGQSGNVWADSKDDGPGKVKVFVYVRDYPNVI